MDMSFKEIRKNRKLYIINKSEKKSIVIWIVFYFPLDINASLNALLSRILLKGSSNYKTSIDISRALYQNYGAAVGSDINLKGEIYTLSFYADFIKPIQGFTDKKFIGDICNIFKDIVLNPLLEKGSFKQKYFDIEKENLINDIKNKINNKDSYAFSRCIEIMCEMEPYSIDKLGKVGLVEEASVHSLTQRYFNIINNCPMDVYIMGDINNELINCINGFFPEYGAKVFEKNNYKISNNSVKEINAYFDVQQSRFCFGFRTGINLNSDDFPALVLLNNILGGGPNSILFNEVREKDSLCYSINSSIEKFKELLFVNCGIDSKNEIRVKNKVLEIIEKIKNGNINDSDYENALINAKHNLKKISDDSFYYISYIQGLNIYNSSYTIEELSKRLNNVKKTDIITASKKLKLDTIYFLSSREKE